MSKQWHYQLMGETVGPVSSADLVVLASRQAIQPDTPVRLAGKQSWMPAERIKGLFPKPEPTATPEAAAHAPVESDTYHILPAAGGDSAPRGERKQSPPVEAEVVQSGGEFEFFQFVGFEEAISHALYEELVQYARKKNVSITQVTRQALAEFLGKPELAAMPGAAEAGETAAPADEAMDQRGEPASGATESSAASESEGGFETANRAALKS